MPPLSRQNWGKNFLARWNETGRNGSTINGQHIGKGSTKELKQGDNISLGKEKEGSFIFHYPRHFNSQSDTPGSSQRTQPVSERGSGDRSRGESRERNGLEPVAEESRNSLDSLFSDDGADTRQPAARPSPARKSYAEEESSMRGPAAAEAGEVAGGADSLLFSDGDKDQDATSQRGDSPGGGGPRRHNSNTLKRRDAVSEPSRSEASVERRYSGESFAVEPTPHAESPSLGSSMPPSTERKRRDSEPLVKDSMPMGAADRSSPSASLDAGQDNGVERRSDHKPGAFTKFQQLQEEHRSKMAEKGAIIQQLEDDKSQLQADLRRLRKESASSEKREEEHRQTESQLSEARRQVRSLQEEKDRLAQRTSDEERKTEREREKRAEAERQLEDLQARLRERETSHRQELERLGRERDAGLGGALDHLQSKLRATVESEIDAARTCAHAPAAETLCPSLS